MKRTHQFSFASPEFRTQDDVQNEPHSLENKALAKKLNLETH